MAIVTPTDRSKSVRNRCVIEVFGGVFLLSRCFLDFSVGIVAFVIGLSQISSFFLFEYVLLVETNPFLELVVFSGLLTSNISRYFLDFASEASDICNPASVNFKWFEDFNSGNQNASTTSSKSNYLRNAKYRMMGVSWTSPLNQGKLTIGNPKSSRLS